MKTIYTLLLGTILSLSMSAQPITEYFTADSDDFGVTGTDYGDGMHRIYNIQVDAGNRIQLTIDYDLEECCDNIYIYEPSENGSGSILAETINTYGEHQYVTQGNHIIVEFTTDGSVNNNSGYNGFTVDYTVTGEPATLGKILPAQTAVLGHSDKPNLIVSEPNYKSMNGSANNRVNFDNSTLLVKTGDYYQLGFGEQTIASSSSLYLKSAGSMYFNSNGYYYFNSPNTSSPTAKVDVQGSMAISGSSSSSAYYSLDVSSGKGSNYKGGLRVNVADGKQGITFTPETAVVDGTSELTVLRMWATGTSGNWASSLGITSSPTFTGDGTSKTWFGMATKNKFGIALVSGHKDNTMSQINSRLMIGYDSWSPDFTKEEVLSVNGSTLIKGDLETEGIIKATEIIVEANENTADFVFESDYNLRDLSEVESFIKANKHLPEIPSAAQMEKQGVNLAEMNKLLLQKVEELTLYSIDLQKKDKEIRDKLRDKDKEVKELNEARKTEQSARAKMEERLAKIEALLLGNAPNSTPNP